MDTPAKPTSMLDPELSRRCFEQLERESVGLTALAAMAQQLRHAIGLSASEGWAAALHLQDAMVAQASAMHNARQAWRAELAAALGVSLEQVTLSTIASRLGEPARTELLHRRQRLREQLQEFTRLNNFNLFLVRAHLEALRRFFLDLTGAGDVSGRYNRAGACHLPARGALVHMKG